MAGALSSIGWTLTLDDSEFNSVLKALNSNVNRLQNNFNNAATGPVGNISRQMNSINSTVSQMSQGMQSTSSDILNILNQTKKSGILETVKSLPSMAKAAASAFMGPIAPLVDILGSIVGGGIGIVTGLLKKIIEPITSLVDVLTSPVFKILGSFMTTIMSALEPIFMVLRMAIAPIVFSLFPILTKFLFKMTGKFMDWIVDKIPVLISAAGAVGAWLDRHWPSIKNAASVFVITIGKAIAFSGKMIYALGEFTAKAIPQLTSFLKDIYKQNKEFFTEQNSLSEWFNNSILGGNPKAIDDFWGSVLDSLDNFWTKDGPIYRLFKFLYEDTGIKKMGSYISNALYDIGVGFGFIAKEKAPEGLGDVGRTREATKEGRNVAITMAKGDAGEDYRFMVAGGKSHKALAEEGITAFGPRSTEYWMNQFKDQLAFNTSRIKAQNMILEQQWQRSEDWGVGKPYEFLGKVIVPYTNKNGTTGQVELSLDSYLDMNALKNLDLVSGGSSAVLEYETLYRDAIDRAGQDARKKALKEVKVKQFALGGIIQEPTFAQIGEKGSEMVVPLSKQGDRLTDSQISNIQASLTQGLGSGDVKGLLKKMVDILSRIAENTEDSSWMYDSDFNGQNMSDILET